MLGLMAGSTTRLASPGVSGCYSQALWLQPAVHLLWWCSSAIFAAFRLGCQTNWASGLCTQFSPASASFLALTMPTSYGKLAS